MMVVPPVEDQTGEPARISFGLYEVDLRAGELWKSGFRVRLQSQPFKVLTALLAKPGEVVTRESLQMLVWGRDTTVDFDHSLGTAINKLREALGDSADNPRFIETLAKRGYRFIAPVTTIEQKEQVKRKRQQNGAFSTASTVDQEEVAGTPFLANAAALNLHAVGPKTADQRRHDWGAGLLAGGVVIGMLAGLAIGLWRGRLQPEPRPLRIDQVTHTSRISPGAPNMESLPAFATDGVRLFASVLEEGKPQLSVIYIKSGDVQRLPVPEELVSASIEDLSRDGSKLLVISHLSSESEQPVWIMPTTGGSALRVGNIRAHNAAWMPDGESILYANGNELAVSRLQDGSTTHYATVPGRAFWMRWSPDGKLLRLTVMDPRTHTSSLWELDSSHRTPRPLLGNGPRSSSDCCGTWTADGEAYLFQSEADGISDLWRMKNGSRSWTPVKLTNGPLSYGSPVAAPAGHRIFFLGLDTQSELQRLSSDGKEFQPENDFLSSANRVDYSRDRMWVEWTDRDGKLWRARAADGAEKLQLTPDYLQVFLAHWSPDGRRLALMAREPGQAWQIYLIGADGGTPERLLNETRNVADPGWSPDGRSLVFGREPDLMGKESGSHTIEMVTLDTGQVTTLPNSEGLFSPRWSPDGRYIAALSLDQRRVMLYEVGTRQWRKLADSSAADPVWSADSRWLFFHATMSEKQPILKVSVPTGQLETVASLDSFRAEETADYFFVGITPENVPLVRARLATGNLYTLSLDEPSR